MWHLYNISSKDNVRADEIVNKAIQKSDKDNTRMVKANCSKLLNENTRNNTWENFMKLKEQNKLIRHLIEICTTKVINEWQSLVKSMPKSIFNFAR